MRVVFGGPGTGKTTYLLDRVDAALQAGTPPSRIAYLAFTRQAAYEAKERARQQFGLTDAQLPYFRTLHSLCYRELAYQQGDILGKPDMKEIGDLLGLTFGNGGNPAEGPPVGGNPADRMMHVIGYARARAMSLEDAWHQTGEGVAWYELMQLWRTINTYKHDTGKADFADLLDHYAKDGPPLPVDIGIVDEAQDLSPKQWAVAIQAMSEARDVIVAGDDDQAIYRWSGADVTRFLDLAKGAETTVLPTSHRLPRQVFDLATEISARIQLRQPKDWKPADHDGTVRWVMDPLDVDLSEGEWLLLARNNYLLKDYREACLQQGVAYTEKGRSSVRKDDVRAIIAWERLRKGERVEGDHIRSIMAFHPEVARRSIDPEQSYRLADLDVDDQQLWHDSFTHMPIEDREYYLTILRRGERLQDPPRVRIGSIHSAKGGQADNVVVRTDMTPRSHAGYQLAPDDEHRVFYVGCTRAKKNLILLAPQGTRYYDL